MAFPNVGATSHNKNAVDSTQHTITLPSHNVGDLLLVLFYSDDSGSSAVSVGSGAAFTNLWTTVTGGFVRSTGWAFICTANNHTLRLDTANNEMSAHVCYRIDAKTYYDRTIAAAVAVGTAATGTSGTPDPPNLAPSWGAKDNLWIAAYVWDGNIAHSGYPTNYGSNQVTDNDANAGGGGAAIASRNLNASSENPGTGSVASTARWIAQTLGIRPAGSLVAADIRQGRNALLRR